MAAAMMAAPRRFAPRSAGRGPCPPCLACMTTCPSGVHYMHLVDHGRRRIAETYDRPLADRLVRALLAAVLPHPGLFRLALVGAWFAGPLARFLPARLAAMLRLAPSRLPASSPVDRPQIFSAEGERVRRVALLAGCAQQVLAPEINEATIRLLTRHGCEVVVAKGAGCCGALTHHLGRQADAHASAKANIAAWWREREGAGLAAVGDHAAGCGSIDQLGGKPALRLVVTIDARDWAPGGPGRARLDSGDRPLLAFSSSPLLEYTAPQRVGLIEYPMPTPAMEDDLLDGRSRCQLE